MPETALTFTLSATPAPVKSAPPSWGWRLHAAMKQARQSFGGKLTDEQWVAAAEAFKVKDDAMTKRKPKGAPRARNPLFDALALATGTRDLEQLTRLAAKNIAVALAEIEAVTPELTVDEIQRRAAAYKRRWPDPRNLSATALAKHWGQFALTQGEAKTAAAKNDVYQEPVGWVDAAAVLYGDDIANQMKDRGWFELSTDYRRNICRELQRTDTN